MNLRVFYLTRRGLSDGYTLTLNTKIPGEDGAFLGDFYGVVFRKNYLFALFK